MGRSSVVENIAGGPPCKHHGGMEGYKQALTSAPEVRTSSGSGQEDVSLPAPRGESVSTRMGQGDPGRATGAAACRRRQQQRENGSYCTTSKE